MSPNDVLLPRHTSESPRREIEGVTDTIPRFDTDDGWPFCRDIGLDGCLVQLLPWFSRSGRPSLGRLVP